MKLRELLSTLTLHLSITHSTVLWLITPLFSMNKDPPAGAVDSLSTGAAVGITVVTTAVVIFIAGVLTGVLFYHCISHHRSQSAKPVSASNQQQQTGPEYEEVVDLSENLAYNKPVQSIEMRANEAYQYVQH